MAVFLFVIVLLFIPFFLAYSKRKSEAEEKEREKARRQAFIDDMEIKIQTNNELLRKLHDKENNNYGGYSFSDAQMEIVDGFSEDKLTTIGEIMARGLSEKKKAYQIKQDLFYSPVINWDSDFFVRLHFAKGDIKHEKELMYDFFSGYDSFETEEEVYKTFNDSKFLNKYPRLKNAVIKNALSYID
jgi:hypothetical protein